MKQIKNLKDLVKEEAYNDKLVVIPKEILDYVDYLIDINKKLNEESKHSTYNIEIDYKKYNNNVAFKLIDVNHNIELYNNTENEFIRFKGDSYYNKAGVYEPEYIVEEKVTLKDNPELFKNIIEDQIITVFLSNEKILYKENKFENHLAQKRKLNK